MKVDPKAAPLVPAAPPEPLYERYPTTLSFLVVLCYLLLGTLIGVYLEGWEVLTSVYVSMQVMTTIGYGDITPKTSAGQWFMCFYVIFGIAIVANIINQVIGNMLEWQMSAMRTRLRAVEQGEGGDAVAEAKYGGLNRLLSATAVFAILLVAFATLYSTLEDCSCSYGKTAVAECVPDDCAAHGSKKTWAEAFYMAVITFATVGFGDFTPLSHFGRSIGVPLTVVGVAAAANFLASISNYITEVGKRKKSERTVTAEVLQKMDTNQDGSVSKNEFRMYMLLKEGIISEEDLTHIDAVFVCLDKHNKGKVPVDVLSQKFDGR